MAVSGSLAEAGIALTGTEVKSLRNGRAAIAESYADAKNGEIWLINANIPEYLQASRFNHAPKRPRKLLLHKRQIRKLAAAVEREGMTIVPLRLFFSSGTLHLCGLPQRVLRQTSNDQGAAPA